MAIANLKFTLDRVYTQPLHLAEVVVLGNAAMRVQKKFLWDGPNLKALNCPEVDAFIRPEYHNGWTL